MAFADRKSAQQRRMLSWLKSLFSAGANLDEATMAKLRPLVEGLIKSQSQPVVVFSKSTCPYCSRAKRTLADEFDPTLIKTIELDQEEDGGAIQAYLAQRANKSHVTVPQIFIKDKSIGGNDNLQALLSRRGEWKEIKASISSPSPSAS